MHFPIIRTSTARQNYLHNCLIRPRLLVQFMVSLRACGFVPLITLPPPSELIFPLQTNHSPPWVLPISCRLTIRVKETKTLTPKLNNRRSLRNKPRSRPILPLTPISGVIFNLAVQLLLVSISGRYILAIPLAEIPRRTRSCFLVSK